MHYYTVKLKNGLQFTAPIQRRNIESCKEDWFSLMPLDYDNMPEKIMFSELEYIIDERNGNDITERFLEECKYFKNFKE